MKLQTYPDLAAGGTSNMLVKAWIAVGILEGLSRIYMTKETLSNSDEQTLLYFAPGILLVIFSGSTTGLIYFILKKASGRVIIDWLGWTQLVAYTLGSALTVYYGRIIAEGISAGDFPDTESLMPLSITISTFRGIATVLFFIAIIITIRGLKTPINLHTFD
ncbi:MAG: hypothetical protein AAGK66_08420 [Pseudomonadota bacterium]